MGLKCHHFERLFFTSRQHIQELVEFARTIKGDRSGWKTSGLPSSKPGSTAPSQANIPSTLMKYVSITTDMQATIGRLKIPTNRLIQSDVNCTEVNNTS